MQLNDLSYISFTDFYRILNFEKVNFDNFSKRIIFIVENEQIFQIELIKLLKQQLELGDEVTYRFNIKGKTEERKIIDKINERNLLFNRKLILVNNAQRLSATFFNEFGKNLNAQGTATIIIFQFVCFYNAIKEIYNEFKKKYGKYFLLVECNYINEEEFEKLIRILAVKYGMNLSPNAIQIIKTSLGQENYCYIFSIMETLSNCSSKTADNQHKINITTDIINEIIPNYQYDTRIYDYIDALILNDVNKILKAKNNILDTFKSIKPIIVPLGNYCRKLMQLQTFIKTHSYEKALTEAQRLQVYNKQIVKQIAKVKTGTFEEIIKKAVDIDFLSLTKSRLDSKMLMEDFLNYIQSILQSS